MILLNKNNDIFIGAIYVDANNEEWSVTSIFEQEVNLRNMNRNLIWFEHRFRKVTCKELNSNKYKPTGEYDINHIPFRVGDRILLEDNVPGFPKLTKGKTIYIYDYIASSDTPLYVYELDNYGCALSPLYVLPLNAIQEIVDHPTMKGRWYPLYFNEKVNDWIFNDSNTEDEYYLD
jgi:hypothetical protein